MTPPLVCRQDRSAAAASAVRFVEPRRLGLISWRWICKELSRRRWPWPSGSQPLAHADADTHAGLLLVPGDRNVLMPYRTRLLLLVVGAWFCVTSSRPALGAEDFAFYHENVMGTSLELRVIARDPEAAAWAEGQVLAEIDRLSRIFSSYDATSEFRRWQDNPQRTGAAFGRALRAAVGLRPLARPERRGVRRQGRGAELALRSRGPAKDHASRR